MGDLFQDIQEALEDGVLSFAEIATKFEVPVAWVTEVQSMLQEYNSQEIA